MSQQSLSQQQENVNNSSTGPAKIFKNCQWLCRTQASNKKKSPNYPCKRWGHTAVIHDKYMYVFGGCGKSENQKQWEQLYRMDCMTFNWERMTSNSNIRPQGRDSHTCVVMQNKLFFYGGSCNDQIFADLWYYDLDTQEWVQIPTHQKLEAREGHSAMALSDRVMYIYGGWDSERSLMLNHHWLFDCETNEFLKVENITGDEIPKRESHSCNLVGDSVFIFGGQGQNVGKNNQFFKDLYQIQFESFTSIHQKFNQYSEDKKKDPNIEPPTISLQAERIKSTNGQQPSARASHSAVTYLDRFLFIIGGEGQYHRHKIHQRYKHDQSKDNDGYDISQQEQEVNSNEDDEMKPLYPKNDVWIFETIMRTWTKLIPKSKTPIFQPRFSSSCVVFKDQLVIFGGLRSMGDVLEDIFVLHLKDSENHLQKFQREEMKNICKYCQMIYGIQSDDDLLIKQTSINEPIRISPKLSVSFIHSLSNLIEWPFAAIGLLIDNAKISKAKELRISQVERTRRFVSSKQSESKQKVMIEDENYEENDDKRKAKSSSIENLPTIQLTLEFEEIDIASFTEQEFIEIIHYFEIAQLMVGKTSSDKERIAKNGQTAEELIRLETERYMKRIYGNNLKLSGLRIGQSLLMVHKNGNSYYIGLISTNNSINPNIEDLIIFHYMIKITDGKLTYSNEQQRSLILNTVNFITEDELIGIHKKDFSKIIIFDLMKLPIKNAKPYELIMENQDIINQNYLVFADSPPALIDYSLKEYLRAYTLDKFQDFQIFIGGEPLEINGLDAIFAQQQFIDRGSLPSGRATKRLYESSRRFQFLAQNEKQLGILVYSNGRLIDRLKKKLGKLNPNSQKLEVTGYIEVQEFLEPNLFLNGFTNQYLYNVFSTSVDKIFEKKNKEPNLKRKNEEKISSEEPKVEKEIKVNDPSL